MKTVVGWVLVTGAFLLAGCSADLETEAIGSDAEEIAAKAEVLSEEIDMVVDTVEEFETKNLTAEDQERLADEIAYAKQSIEQFQTTDETLIGKAVKELSEEKMKEAEEVLSDVQQNAEEGKATKEDLEKVKEVLKEDISFSLFGN